MTASRSVLGVTCMPVRIAGPAPMGTAFSGDLTLVMMSMIATGGGIAEIMKSGASVTTIGTRTEIGFHGTLLSGSEPLIH